MMIQITREKSVPAAALVPFLVFFLMVVGSGALWYFLWQPAQDELTRLEQELRTEQQQIDVLLTVLARRPMLEEQLAEKQEEWAEAQIAITGPQDAVAAAQYAERRIAQAGITESHFFYQPVHRNSDLPYVPIQWEAKASFRQLKMVVLDWEQRFPTLKIDLIQMGPAENGSITLFLEGRLLLLDAKDEEIDWQPQADNRYPDVVAPGRYGPAFQMLQTFYNQGPRVLGVVITDGQERALVRENGSERWMRVGEELGPGRIAEVRRTGVVVNIGGLMLELLTGRQ